MKNNKISTKRLAQICNVSQGTIDRALHNRKGISDKTKEYILSVAKEYGYRPNKNGLVGIIVFDLYNEYFSELIMFLEKELRRRGYYSLVMFSEKDKKKELECIEAMYDAGVNGLILCPVNGKKDFAQYLNSWKIPVVTIGNKVDGIKYVGIDNFKAMKELATFVVSKGFREILYYSPSINNDCNMYAQEQRINAFKSFAEEENIMYKVVNTTAELEANVRNVMGIIASTDVYALKALFLEKTKECLVVGFDDIPSLYNYKIPLTTLSYDNIFAAQKVVDYIINPDNNEDVFIDYIISEKNHR